MLLFNLWEMHIWEKIAFSFWAHHSSIKDNDNGCENGFSYLQLCILLTLLTGFKIPFQILEYAKVLLKCFNVSI